MSWDAVLSYGDEMGRDWNYTHNTSRMIYRSLEASRYPLPTDPDRPDQPLTWWKHLDGMTAEDSVPFLEAIIGPLMEAPALFREMNPENGWGDYDSLLGVLAEMRLAAKNCPAATWWAGG